VSVVVQPVDRLDVRLVPAALLAWGTVLLGLLGGWQLAAAVAVGALAGLPLVLRLDNRAVAAGLFVCLVMTSGFSVATTLRAHAVATHPLQAAARRRRYVDARAAHRRPEVAARCDTRCAATGIGAR